MGMALARCAAAEELLGQRRQQRVAARLDGGVGLRQAGGEDVEQRAEVVAAFEHHRRQFAADRDFAVAQLVEDVFDLVREGFDEVAFDDAGATLDGVRGAEDGAEVVGVVGRLLELEQAVFHGEQLVAAFGDEGTGQFIHRVLSSFLRSIVGRRFQALAEMTIGSPKTPTRLQKSRTCWTAGLWPLIVRRLPCCSTSRLSSSSSCRPAVSISATPRDRVRGARSPPARRATAPSALAPGRSSCRRR
jgi:hypothetical protein